MSFQSSIIFRRFVTAFLSAAVLLSAPVAALAQSSAVLIDTPVRVALASVYAERPDLQQFFDAGTWKPLGFAQTGDLADLDDWAMRYGHREHPKELRRYALAAVYAQRGDLQRFFDAGTWKPLGFAQTGDLADLEDWAIRYGHREHPKELVGYVEEVLPVPAPAPAPPVPDVVPPPSATLPPALVPIDGVRHPVLRAGAAFDFSSITASKVLVVDPVSRRIILAKDAAAPHSAASITKLMTAIVLLENRIPLSLTHTITTADEVGGARLRVSSGTPLSVNQLFMTMLVGSANNAAHALSRTTGTTTAFVQEMNAKAKVLGLASTRFVDPTGIEVENVSTAQDIAALLITALEKPEIRRAASTVKYTFVAEGTRRDIKNTNGLLVDPDNGLYVLGGKTGYLIESKWNLAVKMRGMDAARQPSLIVVTLGSESQTGSFQDSERIARWVWNNATWVR